MNWNHLCLHPKSQYFDEVPNLDDEDTSTLKAFDYDENRTKYISEMLHQDVIQVDNRNEKYTLLLEEYVQGYKKRQPDNRLFKWLFFIIFIGIFIIIVLVTSKYINIASQNINSIDINSSIGLVTSCVTLITSIIVIPKIIAKYLFSIEEDKFMAEIIKSMFLQDDKIRKSIHSRHNDNDIDLK